MREIQVGDRVIWDDPCSDTENDEYEVFEVSEDVVKIRNSYSEAEVPPHELILIVKL